MKQHDNKSAQSTPVLPCLSPSGHYGEIHGVTPPMLKRLYGADGANFPTGIGITCGIVVPFGSPSLAEDLAVFSRTFSLPDADLIIRGGENASKTAMHGEWVLESSLDIQWLHAWAPDSRLIAYFAESDSFEAVFDALQSAERECDIVSLSLGKEEFEGETAYEAFFAQSRALFTGAAGDNQTARYPSCSAHVLCVGGTRAFTDSAGDLIGEETVWNGTGSGISRYIDSPAYQRIFGTIYADSNGKRAIPDLAFFASGENGAALYHSTEVLGNSGWTDAVGTSIGAPCIAGLCACTAEKNRTVLRDKNAFFYRLAGQSAYTDPHRAFRDIVRGESGGYFASEGYDFCSGLGTPRADRWVKPTAAASRA